MTWNLPGSSLDTVIGKGDYFKPSPYHFSKYTNRYCKTHLLSIPQRKWRDLYSASVSEGFESKFTTASRMDIFDWLTAEILPLFPSSLTLI